MNRKALCSVVFVFLAAAACGGSEPAAKAPEPPPAAASTAPATTSTESTANQGVPSLASATTGGANPEAAGQPASSNTSSSTAMSTALSDDQILYVLHAANLAEMEQARVAQTKAKNGRVKRFASMMLKDHGEADSSGNDVAKKVRASLSPSDTSRRLEADAKQLGSSIAAQKGNEFDRTYIDAQVKEHRAVLDAIDKELLPAVKADDVKQLVQTVRTKVQGHLEEAEQIQKGFTGK